MSTEHAEEFIRSLMGDQDLLQELNERVDLSGDVSEEERRAEMGEVVPEMAAEHGYEFTADEGFGALESLRGDEGDALTDQELERVAGGKDITPESYGGSISPNC